MNRGKTCKAIRSSVGEKIEAKIAELKNPFFKISAPIIVALMLLTSCLPGNILEINPTLTQATEIPAGIIGPTNTQTTENTATNTATMPAINTATPEASPTPEMTTTP